MQYVPFDFLFVFLLGNNYKQTEITSSIVRIYNGYEINEKSYKKDDFLTTSAKCLLDKGLIKNVN